MKLFNRKPVKGIIATERRISQKRIKKAFGKTSKSATQLKRAEKETAKFESKLSALDPKPTSAFEKASKKLLELRKLAASSKVSKAEKSFANNSTIVKLYIQKNDQLDANDSTR